MKLFENGCHIGTTSNPTLALGLITHAHWLYASDTAREATRKVLRAGQFSKRLNACETYVFSVNTNHWTYSGDSM